MVLSFAGVEEVSRAPWPAPPEQRSTSSSIRW